MRWREAQQQCSQLLIVVNWTSKADSMVWLLDVHTAGPYEVSIDDMCLEPDAGASI